MQAQDSDYELKGAGDLPQLLQMLTVVVTTLDAVGADGYRNCYVYISGSKDGAPMTELAVEDGRMWVSGEGQSPRTPRYRRAANSGEDRALLMAQLYYAMWYWRIDAENMADHLGCGTYLLDRWMANAREADAEPIALPSIVAQRMRHIAIIEHQRLAAAVPDSFVADWIREARPALCNRSIIDLLFNDGEAGFRRVQLWLLNRLISHCETVH